MEIGETIRKAISDWYFEQGKPEPNWESKKDLKWWTEYLKSLDETEQTFYNNPKYLIVMDYKPYTLEWTRKRALQQAIYEYLEDVDTSPEQICEDIRDVLEDWVNEYSSRAEKGKVLQSLFSN